VPAHQQDKRVTDLDLCPFCLFLRACAYPKVHLWSCDHGNGSVLLIGLLHRARGAVPYPKAIRALATPEMSSFCFRRLASQAGVPDRQRAPARREPMAEPAASRREASFAAGEVAASGGAALVPMVEPVEDRQCDDRCSAFRLVAFSAVRCVLAEGQSWASDTTELGVGAVGWRTPPIWGFPARGASRRPAASSRSDRCIAHAVAGWYDESMSKAKIAITLEPATIAQVRAQVRSRRSPSVSAYIASAVSARLESESMARLVADIQREHGRPSREAKAWARAVLGR
jgi:hypothetical protein